MTKQQVQEIGILKNALAELAEASKNYMLLKSGRVTGRKRLEEAIALAEELTTETVIIIVP